MSDETWAAIREAASQSAVDICWAQWTGVGSPAAPGGSGVARSIVDVEALILMSLFLQLEERRFADLAAWWARVGVELTSLQRMRTVAKRFPGDHGHRNLGFFATLGVRAGERRWQRWATVGVPDWVRFGKGPEEISILEPCALWPRLRAGFGVGAKADALAFLLGEQGEWHSAADIAFATGYTVVTAGKAVGEMARGRFLRLRPDRPAEYSAQGSQWGGLLAVADRDRDGAAPGIAMPAWRFWSELLAFLAGAIALANEAQSRPQDREHVLASSARDLFDDFTRAFLLSGIDVPNIRDYRGLDAVDGLLETVDRVGAWMVKAL